MPVTEKEIIQRLSYLIKYLHIKMVGVGNTLDNGHPRFARLTLDMTRRHAAERLNHIIKDLQHEFNEADWEELLQQIEGHLKEEGELAKSGRDGKDIMAYDDQGRNVKNVQELIKEWEGGDSK